MTDRRSLADVFATQRFVVLKSFIDEPLLSVLYGYILKVVNLGRTKFGDDLTPNSPCLYGDTLMDTVLEFARPELEGGLGVTLYPTYSYFRLYLNGATLPAHDDRPSCEISTTVTLGYEADEPWPIFVRTEAGTMEIVLERGDALLYRGLEVPHWRTEFTGQHQAQLFMHYVDRNGPYAEYKYDRREVKDDFAV